MTKNYNYCKKGSKFEEDFEKLKILPQEIVNHSSGSADSLKKPRQSSNVSLNSHSNMAGPDALSLPFI